jgi:hypothetical protein
MIIIAIVIVVSLLTAPPAREQWEPFLWRPGLLMQVTRDNERPWYKRLTLWFGLYAAGWFYIYWRFW